MHWTIHLEGGPRRVNHAAVAVGDLIYSFGGYCTGENYGHWRPIDVHCLDTVTLRWKLVSCMSGLDQMQVYDPRNTDIPFQRYGHTVVAHGDVVYLWGGRNDACACNVLYAFDTINKIWLPKPKAFGLIPSARDGHSACVIDKCMYIFGGYEEEAERFSQDVYVLNLETFEWRYLSVIGTAPAWRDFHSCAAVGDRMYVFGGRSDQTGQYHSQHEVYHNEIVYLNVRTCTWIKPSIHGSCHPEGRRSHSLVTFNNKIYMFGGFNGTKNTHYNDLHEYDPQTSRWTLIEGKGQEQPCARRRQCCCMVGSRMFLFGGTSPYREAEQYIFQQLINQLPDMALRDHSDLYVLDFAPSLKTLSILVALEKNLIQLKDEKLKGKLPDEIISEMKVMTTHNNIYRALMTPNTG